MYRILTVFLCLILSTLGWAQDKKAFKYAKTITPQDLEERLTVLASDSLEGRETGKRGQKMAADYIKSHFEKFGFAGPVDNEDGNGFYQKFDLYKMVTNEIFLEAGNSKLEYLKNLIFFGGGSTNGVEKAEAVFFASGKDLDNVESLEGKLAVFFTEDGNWRGLADKAKSKGVMGSLILSGANDEEFGNTLKKLKGYLMSDKLSLVKPEDSNKSAIFFGPPSFGESLFGLSEDSLRNLDEKILLTTKINYKIDRGVESVGSENVLGFLEGSDAILKNEILVITSHYDHLGKRGDVVYNGADDDGSGTTSLLEIAEAFSIASKKNQGPKRSVLFMTVSGEEKGLLGSDYYTQNPVFPLENTVTNLNIDMVGRIDSAHMDTPNYVYVIGADKLSSELHEISERINKNTEQLVFDYKYNDDNDPNRFYYRSDHYNFAKNNVPIIFYFNGVHEDYHQPTDTVEKIEFEVMAKRAKLVFHMAWELANRDKRVKLD